MALACMESSVNTHEPLIMPRLTSYFWGCSINVIDQEYKWSSWCGKKVLGILTDEFIAWLEVTKSSILPKG